LRLDWHVSEDFEGIKVDRTKLVIEPDAWNDRDYAVRYAGEYAGCIKLVGESED